jgi:hypothetical protein
MWGWIPNGSLAARPSRVTIRRKATAEAAILAIRYVRDSI